MEPNPTRAKHQKEAVLVAQDVYHYLSSSVFPENVIRKSSEKSNYHQNMGKACSYRLKFARSSFREVCVKEFPDRPLGSKDFVSWFQGVLSRNCQECKSVFSSALETLSLMFEAVCYAVERGQMKLYHILPIMWTNYFMQKLYPDFFKEGGWHGLVKAASKTVRSYQEFFLSSEPGALELIAGFKEDDPAPTEVADKSGSKKEKSGSKKGKQIEVPHMLQNAGFPATVDESSNLAKTLKGLLNLGTAPIGQDLINFYMQECVAGATPKNILPGNRKMDPLRTYDTSPQVSPQESPACAKKKSGKETSAKKKKEKSGINESEGHHPIYVQRPMTRVMYTTNEASSPEVSPPESPVCARKNSGKETSGKKKKEKSEKSDDESEPQPLSVEMNLNMLLWATREDVLPGNRKEDSNEAYDTTPEVSPQESPVCARKKSGKATSAKKKKEKSGSNESEPRHPADNSVNVYKRRLKLRCAAGKGKKA